MILRKAAIADRLETQLIETLSQLSSMEGNLDLPISSIVIRLLRDIDWDRQLQNDLTFARREVDNIRAAVRDWARRVDGTTTDDGESECDEALTDHLRELANRLRKVGESLEHRQQQRTPTTESSSVRAAASAVDRAAQNLAEGRGNESELVAALGDATNAISSPSATSESWLRTTTDARREISD